MTILPEQLANLATAALGPTPPSAEFFRRVDEFFLVQAPEEQPENKILGATYETLENADKSPQSVQNQMSAYKALLGPVC